MKTGRRQFKKEIGKWKESILRINWKLEGVNLRRINWELEGVNSRRINWKLEESIQGG